MAHWVKAGVVENRFEGDRVSQALKEAEIPFMMKSFHDTAYDGLYIPQKGWAVVMVPENLRAEAEKLLIEVKKIFQEEGKDEIEKMEVKNTKGLGLSEMMEDVPYSSDMSYADLLRMAIKNEEKSQQLYISTAKLVKEANLKKLLLVLAQEESTHKEKLEKIYDKEVLQEF